MGRKKIDLAGQTFGRLTVIREAGRTKAKKVTWLCRCECGNEKTIVGTSLRNGSTSSCGCLQPEVTSKRRKVHGMSDVRFYNIWRGIRYRCENPSCGNYEDYGGRGITVCERWQSFENFRDDLLESYEAHVKEHGESNTSIDRIEVNGDYELSNVRWATRFLQNRNQRRRSGNTSGTKGVYWYARSEKWRAQITVNGNMKHLGTFADKDLAVAARKEAERKYFKDSSIA